MYSMTRFSRLLNHLPKDSFKNIIKQTNSDHYLKKLKTWDVLTLMMYGQISQTKSLRTLITGFNSHSNKHYHLNTQEIRRSTLSEALSKRKIEPFKQMCELLMKQVSKKHKRECKQMISIIDSTPIKLKGHGYEWTAKNHSHRTQGLKLHVELDGETDAPVYTNITHANLNDITDAKHNIELRKGVTYILDKGYCDYNWWHDIDQSEAQFVTRIKSNTAYKVIASKESEDNELIISDQTIHLTNKLPRAKATNLYAFKDLRLITVKREGKKPMGVVTNDFKRSATEIASLYKQRWQIELFFKWVKQKLKLKTFFGRSENATRIQIYCALIVYLAMKLMKVKNRTWESMLELQTWLQHGLFVQDATNEHYYQRYKLRKKLIQKIQMQLTL